MSDVLSRYNTATNAYSNSVGSANEFQKSYNQQFYNDFLGLEQSDTQDNS